MADTAQNRSTDTTRIWPAQIWELAGYVALIFVPVLIGNAGERILDWMLL